MTVRASAGQGLIHLSLPLPNFVCNCTLQHEGVPYIFNRVSSVTKVAKRVVANRWERIRSVSKNLGFSTKSSSVLRTCFTVHISEFDGRDVHDRTCPHYVVYVYCVPQSRRACQYVPKTGQLAENALNGFVRCLRRPSKENFFFVFG